MPNYFLNRTNAAFKLTLLASLLVVAAIARAPSVEASESDEWIMTIETEELKGQFTYKNCPLSPVAKIVVKYSKSMEPNSPSMFEYLWYHDGKPIGMEQRGEFKVNRGDLAAIDVVAAKGKPLGTEECKAAAGTIMRLGLLAYHNSNPIDSIQLPADAFDEICAELRNRKCIDAPPEADKSNKSKMLFNLESEPSGKNKRLLFM